jgi:hypothetical protein
MKFIEYDLRHIWQPFSFEIYDVICGVCSQMAAFEDHVSAVFETTTRHSGILRLRHSRSMVEGCILTERRTTPGSPGVEVRRLTERRTTPGWYGWPGVEGCILTERRTTPGWYGCPGVEVRRLTERRTTPGWTGCHFHVAVYNMQQISRRYKVDEYRVAHRQLIESPAMVRLMALDSSD